MVFGLVQLEVLWPQPALPEGIAANDTSLVLRLSYGDQRALLTGDIERSPPCGSFVEGKQT